MATTVYTGCTVCCTPPPIVTACCPSGTPATLYATFSLDMAPLGTVTLVYNSGTGLWEGTGTGCADPLTITLECDYPDFTLVCTDGVFTTTTFFSTYDCTPFYIEGAVASNFSGCDPNGYVVITETPP